MLSTQNVKRSFLTLLAATFFSVSGTWAAVHQEAGQAPEKDNTKKNLPTEHADPNRADQQSHKTSDVELTRRIRRSITSDKSLSTYAHNVKIIARDGVVYLKGPVRSEDERAAVVRKAVDVVGETSVKNELTVKAS